MIAATALCAVGCSEALKIGMLPPDGGQVVVVPVPEVTAAPAASAAPAPCPDGMAWIPGGTFEMGSDDQEDEKPVHDAGVGSFCLDMTEVTADAYAECVRRGECDANGVACEHAPMYKAPTYLVEGKGNHPINCVDWNQATQYCGAHDKRLPSEEEWEYAARSGSDGRTRTWGEDEPSNQLCWGGISRRDETCPIAHFSRDVNRWGVLDLGGNVREWTSSSYRPDYSSESADATRAIRGESWFDTLASFVRASDRYGGEPTSVTDFVGFRCARDPR